MARKTKTGKSNQSAFLHSPRKEATLELYHGHLDITHGNNMQNVPAGPDESWTAQTRKRERLSQMSDS